MQHTIISRRFGQLDFYMPSAGGAIEYGHAGSTERVPIRAEGSTQVGKPITARPSNFVKKCTAWYKARCNKLGYPA